MRGWLKDIRESKGMTQNQVAEASGVCRTMITELENGNASPSIKTAQAIASTLNFSWIRFYEPEQEAS